MKTIVANWKMYVGTRESIALARGVLLALRGKKVLPHMVVCPPAVALSEVRKVVARSHVALGGQNISWLVQGAQTGEMTARMLSELGATHVLVGHSERRHQLGENDEMVQKKMAAALTAGLTPILCVGETREEREAGRAKEVVGAQLHAVFAHTQPRTRDRFFVAYEPVWAIGTGVPATPADAVEMHTFIRTHLHEMGKGLRDEQFSILYGGSVDGKNAYTFLRESAVDGVLVGSASVKLAQFSEILGAAMDVLEAQAVTK